MHSGETLLFYKSRPEKQRPRVSANLISEPSAFVAHSPEAQYRSEDRPLFLGAKSPA